jgi:hypothetical protein
MRKAGFAKPQDTAMTLKSKKPARPTNRTAKLTDEDDPDFEGKAADSRPWYFTGPFGVAVSLSSAKPRRPVKLNKLDQFGIHIAESKAKLSQARTKKERDFLNQEIRVLEGLKSKELAAREARREAARVRRRFAKRRR